MVRNDRSVHREEKQAFDQLLKSCLFIDSHQNGKKLSILRENFANLSQDFHSQVAAFQDKISKAPLSALILLWGELMCNDKMFGQRYLRMMCDLVETGLLPLVSSKKKTETLQDLSSQDPSLIIERIRCYQDWSIRKREDYVLLYKAFSEWLSKESFGYVLEAKDLDRIATQKRLIPFDAYIEILNQMDLREQILAKIFYLGGHKTLEEVLSLKIEDIDFNRFSIHFSEDVSYPCHLFEDIKNYIEGRKKGFIFIGRDGGERISHTTPFRALKNVASELDLDSGFTFKDLTRNV
jgi:hypothetical protein